MFFLKQFSVQFHQFKHYRVITAFILFYGSILALGSAWCVEHLLHIMPCTLCLWERWPWRILFLLSGMTIIVSHSWRRLLLFICFLPLLASLFLGIMHIGVEWGFWSSPFPSCHVPHIQGTTIAQRWNSMSFRAVKPCDAPTYLIPHLPISMALMGVIFTILLLVFLAIVI